MFRAMKNAAALAKKIVSKTIRTGLGLAGGVMLSKREYQFYLTQRDRAARELIEIENKSLKPGLSGIVFSFDRAPQTYVLLKSYFKMVKNAVPLTVLYRASSPAHQKAYNEVIALFKNKPVTFIRETKPFREMALAMLQKITTRSMFVLVDDDILIRPIDLKVAINLDPFKTVLSLRLGEHLRHCYTANVPQNPPAFRKAKEGPEFSEFTLFEAGNEWSDPYSFEATILPTAEIRVLARMSDFKAPNTFEGALKTFNPLMVGRRGLCYKQSRLLNLAINKVQTENDNLAGTISPEFLLAQWNKGLVIDPTPFHNHLPLAPHEEHAIRFVARGKV